MMRKLFPYRGVRIYPIFRHMKAITYFLMLLPFLIAFGFFIWFKQTDIFAEPLLYGLSLTGGLVLVMVFLFIFQKQLYHSTLLFSRFDNWEIMSNFLLSGNYYISKKNQGREKIKFPRVYLKRNRFGLDATFILRGNKFQDKFLRLGADLEIMFDGDFMAKNFTKGFVTYTIAIDQFSGRLTVSDVVMTDKGLRLMSDVYWDFNEQPHLLVGGGTGGGKTVTLMSIVYALVKIGYVWIGDPKKSDFVGFKDVPVFHNQVVWEKDEMVQMLENAVSFMNQRYLEMTQHPEYRAGKRYSAYGMKPLFILFDEWAAFMAEVASDFKLENKVLDCVTQIVLKGRQAGVFMIIAMQRPDGEYIKTALRDNFMKRLSVGHLEDTGYTMMFGDANRSKEFKKIDEIDGEKVYGRGYIANGGEIAREFYSPYVPFDKGFSFVDEFLKIEPLEPLAGYSFKETNLSEPYLPDRSSILDGVVGSIDDIEDKPILMEDLSKMLSRTPQLIRKLISQIEENGYHKFEMVDGKFQFSDLDVSILSSLFEKKETFSGSWRDLLSLYFKGE